MRDVEFRDNTLHIPRLSLGDERTSFAENNNTYLDAIIDSDGKVVEATKKDGTKVFPAGIDSPTTNSLNERVESLEQSSSSRWRGKKLLAIGDSITAPKVWQTRVGELLGMSIRHHAKGGIGIITMVDGETQTITMNAIGDGSNLVATHEFEEEDKIFQVVGNVFTYDPDGIEVSNYPHTTKVGIYTFRTPSTLPNGTISIAISVPRPHGVDPDSFGTNIIYPLKPEDVEGVDIIIAHGFYNERASTYTEQTAGTPADMYDPQTKEGNTFCGRLCYMIKRIYDCLEEAGNNSCRVCLSAPHKYGKYPYIDSSAYEDGDLICKYIKMVANYHSLFYIDCMNGANINRYNWSKFQASPTSYNPKYCVPEGQPNDGTRRDFPSTDSLPDPTLIPNGYYATISNGQRYKTSEGVWVRDTANFPFPWNGDQLHMNKDGYKRLGDFIAGQIQTII